VVVGVGGVPKNATNGKCKKSFEYLNGSEHARNRTFKESAMTIF